MIIKIIPETDVEKMRVKEVEHTGIKEFFIFGNKADADSDAVDFHDWSGSYRYLLGSLFYFQHQLSNEQSSKHPQQQEMQINLAAPQIEGKLIKTSNAEDGKIEGVVEIEPQSNVTPFPKKIPAGWIKERQEDAVEMPTEEDIPNDSSPGAEDLF